MISSHADYRWVYGEDFDRIKIDGGIYPVRTDHSTLRGEDPCYLLELKEQAQENLLGTAVPYLWTNVLSDAYYHDAVIDTALGIALNEPNYSHHLYTTGELTPNPVPMRALSDLSGNVLLRSNIERSFNNARDILDNRSHFWITQRSESRINDPIIEVDEVVYTYSCQPYASSWVISEAYCSSVTTRKQRLFGDLTANRCMIGFEVYDNYGWGRTDYNLKETVVGVPMVNGKPNVDLAGMHALADEALALSGFTKRTDSYQVINIHLTRRDYVIASGLERFVWW